MKKKKQVKDLENSRYGLFMTENSFDLEVMYGRNFLKTDNVQEVILYRINVLKTKSHSLYGQTKSSDKKFMPPIPLSIMITIDPSTNIHYGDDEGSLVRDDTGALSFGVYLKELEEKETEINRGDIIEYNLGGMKNRYYEVVDANNIVDTTDKTIGGFKSYWKEVISTPVKEDIVPFLRETKGD